MLVAGDLNDFEFSDAARPADPGRHAHRTCGTRRRRDKRYSYKFDGHLQTLDHIAVTAGPEVTRCRTCATSTSTTTTTSASPSTAPASPTTTRRWSRSSLARAARARRATSPARCRRRCRCRSARPVTLGPFVAGVAATTPASTVATVTSTAGTPSCPCWTQRDHHRPPGQWRARAGPAAAGHRRGARVHAAAGRQRPAGPAVLDRPGGQRQSTLGFKQTIGANEGLRTGTYGKTLTFTLTTTQP